MILNVLISINSSLHHLEGPLFIYNKQIAYHYNSNHDSLQPYLHLKQAHHLSIQLAHRQNPATAQ